MNKRNFVANYVPLKTDFDALQNDMEGGIKDVASAIAGKGILSGLGVSIAGSEATVTAGVAYDGAGNRMAPAASFRVAIGGISRPSVGNYKWVTLALRYEVKEEGEVIDGKNKTWPARLIDSYSTLLLEGDEGPASTATKPNHLNWQVPLLDIRVDHSSPWENLVTDSGRRPSLLSAASSAARVMKLRADFDAAFPVGTIWMYDGENWKDNVTLPGWYACVPENEDGGTAGLSYGITSMVDRFVMGKAVTGSGATGGANSYKLTPRQLPAHTHTINHTHGTVRSGDRTVKHRHSVTGSLSGGNHTHAMPDGGNGGSSRLFSTHLGVHEYSHNTSGTGSHTHALSVTSGIESAGHRHDVSVPAHTGNSGSTGAGGQIDNRPAFYSLIFVRKCA